LDSDQRPKATQAALPGLRLRVGFARWRRWHWWAEFIGSLGRGQGGELIAGAWCGTYIMACDFCLPRSAQVARLSGTRVE
jgi:hypothetical protein